MGTQKYVVKIEYGEQTGGVPEIRNKSGKTIFMIPISVSDRKDARSEGILKNKKEAKEIKAEEKIVVDWAKFDETGKNTGLQTYILFRFAPADTLDNYLNNLRGKVVNVDINEQLLVGEKLTRHLRLVCAEVNKTDSNAGQGAKKGKGQDQRGTMEADAAKIDIKTALEKISKDMQAMQKKMKENFEDLQSRIANLMNAI